MAKNKAVKKHNDRCKTLQQFIHEPYILPSNSKEYIPSMTAKRFNDMKQEEEAEYYLKLQELIERITNGRQSKDSFNRY